MSKLFLKQVIEKEQQVLLERRRKLGIEHCDEQNGQPNWFGIALSGGGIRSATINLGFLKTLNRFGILKKADYLSSVSGGGYTHAYIQATLKATGDYEKIMTEAHISAFRQHGEYMVPGAGIWKYTNLVLLLVGFLVSWLMSLVSLLVMGGVLYYLYKIVAGWLSNHTLDIQTDQEWLLFWGIRVVGGVFVLHFVSNLIFNFNLSVSKFFNQVEAVLLIACLGIYLWIQIAGMKGGEPLTPELLQDYIINMVLLIIIGFLANPNALSFHRYYRKQLADLYLRFAGEYKNMPLRDVFSIEGEEKNYLAPYPLINTCLNLQNPDGDEKFKGTKASDYFLLSPMFCGSKLTSYVTTDFYADYRAMTLPAAVTISAAAVNPGMGVYSNKILSVVMTLFNARLGFWISNPLKVERQRTVVWWPLYFFRELLGRIGTNNKMVNISDGGHIENLGVYELLRRRCRLIIAFDAGEDKNYSFADLNNLIIRARNELGLEIRFRPDQQPERILRPEPSQVYSKQRFAIADIYQWWEDDKIIADGKEKPNILNFNPPRKMGTFVYVKSTVTAPAGKPYLDENADRLKFGTYKYKIYHPDFPHEPTSDQFFDEIQWEAYFQLGRFIGSEVLGYEQIDQLDSGQLPEITVPQLIDYFDDPAHFPLFAPPRRQVADRAGEEYESFKPASETETTAGSAPSESLPDAQPPQAEYRI